MSKKLVSVFVLVFFFSLFRIAFASLSINEVMYDLSGSDSTGGKSREWIEIYNSDSTDISVDASKWRIYDGSANRTINNQTDFSIPANSYIIFAGDKDTFLADNPSFLGTVYDTGITSLNNTGATLKIIDQDGNALDTVTYTSTQGGAGDGNSLQLVSGSWVGATPTPGLANETISIPPPPDPGVGGLPAGGYASTSTTDTKSKTTEQKIKTQITTKTLNFVGIPLSLQATTTGHSGEELSSGKYFWNFGDGDSREMNLTETQPFIHTYFYPGDYLVSLDYYQNYYSNNPTPDTTSQITIKIIPTDISISKVGDEKDFFIELTNNTNYNADISNWILTSDQKSFTMPRNTIIQPKNKIIISPKITYFSISDKDSLKLMTPQRNIVYSLLPTVTPVVITDVGSGASAKMSTEPVVSISEPKVEPTPVSTVSEKTTASDNLDESATLLQSETGISNNSNTAIIFTISIVFIGVLAYLAYFIRRKKISVENISSESSGKDFEILDE